MIIPLGTDRIVRHTPLATQGLIVANLVIYLTISAGAYFGWFDLDAVMRAGQLDPFRRNPLTFISYQFLHDPNGLLHIGFNMLFLWIFGAAVEERMGRIGFLVFYLVGGAFAGFMHIVASDAPVIGASGSIAGVTGAFLALFPRSKIRILFFFFLIGVYAIPAVWFIGAYFLLDVTRYLGSRGLGLGGRVAYVAHIGGYAYGFGVAFMLLVTRIVPQGEFDCFHLFKQSRRRAAFRATVSKKPVGPWSGPSADTTEAIQRQAKRRRKPSADEERIGLLRATISERVTERDLAGAADLYTDLVAESRTSLPLAQQLDIGNTLYRRGDHEVAATAYEIFLEHFPTAPDVAQVQLLLAITYGRRLGRPERALELARSAAETLRIGAEREMAETLVKELAGESGA